MRRANYWGTAFYNGIVLGIWPAGGLAFLFAALLHTQMSFLAGFVFGLCVFVPFFMWLYHAIVWPRRRRNGQISRR
ncbi:MAG TPA: hypothetical protein VHI51_20945 [Ktedonobacterales bacterium]|nr:hypothetical protein [Ktedonobacterales bacterium]